MKYIFSRMMTFGIIVGEENKDYGSYKISSAQYIDKMLQCFWFGFQKYMHKIVWECGWNRFTFFLLLFETQIDDDQTTLNKFADLKNWKSTNTLVSLLFGWFTAEMKSLYNNLWIGICEAQNCWSFLAWRDRRQNDQPL
jgi:hypothetical protein